MIDINKPHPHTLERQLTDDEEEKNYDAEKKVEERGKKGQLSFLFLFCYSILAYALSLITIGVNGTSK